VIDYIVCFDDLLMITARGVTTAPSANTVEIFVDDNPIQVDPGCTVLQVISLLIYHCLRQIVWITAVRAFQG